MLNNAITVLGALLLVILAIWLAFKVSGNREPDGLPVSTDPPAATLSVPPGFQPPAEPIVLRLSVGQIGGSLSAAVGLIALALWLFTSAENPWLRALAWPAGVIAALFAIWSLWDAWHEHGQRVQADAQGLQMLDGPGGGATQRLAWNQVTRIRLVEHWADEDPNRRSAGKSVRRRELVFEGPAGRELLKLTVPLRPAAANATLLASLPGWTGHAIEIERRGR